MQFVVTAYDGTDAEAPARRQAARPRHLEGTKKMQADGSMILGGAMLDDKGIMIGSVMVVEMPDRAAVDAWLAQDAYSTDGVWKKVEVRPFRVAVKS